MRIWAVAGLGLIGCAPALRGPARPAEAPVGHFGVQAPVVIEAFASWDTGEQPFDDDAIRPCSDADDVANTRPAIDALANQIYALDDGPSPKVAEAVAALETLLTMKCLELAERDLPHARDFDSGASLKHWWGEGGGRESLDSYLEVPMVMTVTPEQPRPTLLLDGHEKSPLAPLLCPAGEADCGKVTRGWLRRIERRFSHPDQESQTAKDPCADPITAATPEERWSVLRTCREGNALRQATLPLGRFKAPTEGFFVMVGQNWRCQTLAIYDLATGARVNADGCSTVNGAPGLEVGRVPVASLREAVWMTMLADVAKVGYRMSDRVPIPAGVVPGRPAFEGGGGSVDLGMFGSRSSRRVVWSWFRPNKAGAYVGQISGELNRARVWDATDHASDLFAIANDGFDASCAPTLPRAALAALALSAPGPTVQDNPTETSTVWGDSNVPALQALVIHQKVPKICTSPL